MGTLAALWVKEWKRVLEAETGPEAAAEGGGELTAARTSSGHGDGEK